LQNCGADVVGKIGNYARHCCRLNDIAEINGEGVGLYQLEVCDAAELIAKLLSQIAIEFDRHDASGSAGQFRGQCAAAGSDFDYSLIASGIEFIDDSTDNVAIDQEVLTKAALGKQG
jgi:hypothetical protein